VEKGQYEYDYDNSNNTNDASQPSSSYPSSAVIAQQTSVEDLNAQYQGLDLGTGHERGREKVVLPIRSNRSLSQGLDISRPAVLDLRRSEQINLTRR
jgi:hypothetical protein